MLTHVARNADSVVRRLEGAARGELLDQYAGGLEQRRADIEAGAGRPAAELVADVVATSAAVARVMAELPKRSLGRALAYVARRGRVLARLCLRPLA